MLHLSYCDKKNFLSAGLFLFVIFIDQATKWIALKYLSGEIFFVVPKIFALKLYQNYSSIFGIYLNPLIFYSVTVLFFLILLVFYQRSSSVFSRVPKLYFVFIIAGAISNIIDRIRFGYIIDFISFTLLQNEIIFNLADCAIVAGTVLIAWRIFIREK